jgi:polyphosphate glucokinase
MKILMIDVGGTNVKLMASGHEGRRKVPSGRKLTADDMVKEVLNATKDWEYEAVSLGYPGHVVDGRPSAEPGNLGNGWVGFDYEAAFKRPVRIINDAAMQALASYREGRMLFLGFGTSVGATIIVDDVIVPLEIGCLRLKSGAPFIERVTAKALAADGKRKWMKAVAEVVELLRDVTRPTDIVLGGGNAKGIDPLPDGCRRKDNQTAFVGAKRLWDGNDFIATSYGSSWRISRTGKGATQDSRPAAELAAEGIGAHSPDLA